MIRLVVAILLLAACREAKPSDRYCVSSVGLFPFMHTVTVPCPTKKDGGR